MIDNSEIKPEQPQKNSTHSKGQRRISFFSIIKSASFNIRNRGGTWQTQHHLAVAFHAETYNIFIINEILKCVNTSSYHNTH
jgi:hypothetical protein